MYDEDFVRFRKDLIESIKELRKWELLEQHLIGVRDILYGQIDYDNYYYEDEYDYDDYGETKLYLRLHIEGEYNLNLDNKISKISCRIDDLWYNYGPIMCSYDRVVDCARWLLDCYY